MQKIWKHDTSDEMGSRETSRSSRLQAPKTTKVEGRRPRLKEHGSTLRPALPQLFQPRSKRDTLSELVRFGKSLTLSSNCRPGPLIDFAKINARHTSSRGCTSGVANVMGRPGHHFTLQASPLIEDETCTLFQNPYSNFYSMEVGRKCFVVTSGNGRPRLPWKDL